MARRKAALSHLPAANTSSKSRIDCSFDFSVGLPPSGCVIALMLVLVCQGNRHRSSRMYALLRRPSQTLCPAWSYDESLCYRMVQHVQKSYFLGIPHGDERCCGGLRADGRGFVGEI